MDINRVIAGVQREINERSHRLIYRAVDGISVPLDTIRKEEARIAYVGSYEGRMIEFLDRVPRLEPVERLRSWCEVNKIQIFVDQSKELVGLTFETFDNYFYCPWKEGPLGHRIREAVYESRAIGALSHTPNILAMRRSDWNDYERYIAPARRDWMFMDSINDHRHYEGMRVVDMNSVPEGSFAVAYVDPTSPPASAPRPPAAVASSASQSSW